MSPGITVVGSCMIDFTCFSPRLPKSGETLIGNNYEIKYGGKGANQCIVASRLGASTAMVASLGNDIYAQEYLKIFKKENIDASHVQIQPNQHSGIAHITVADNGLSILNGAPVIENIDLELLKFCDIFCVNESETEAITGVEPMGSLNMQKAIDILLDKGCNTVILTLGERGAAYASKNDRTVKLVPTTSVQPIDTTGAGDAFLGAFAYFKAYHPELSMNECVRRACVIATESVLKIGTHASFPTRNDLSPDLFV
ncbi:ribokinase isoform X3 [Megachile rotundata]|uniref:ribokinase isoform X3 n=1 Tax=Megachile rotundata TaxID=143995 RepID=UPI0006150AC0|nr:PREDICTED: ribokinase-like isoform X2 [Megachile rotundata]